MEKKRTPHEAKAWIFAQGKTVRQFSKEIGHPEWRVSRLLTGVEKGVRGKTREVAQHLGML